MENNTPTHNYTTIQWLDDLRILAIICVIILHVSSTITADFGTIPLSIWMVGNFMNSTVRFCIPIFVMITGALQLSKEQELFYFLKKGFHRIVLPFMFWGAIHIFFVLYIIVSKGVELSFSTFFRNVYSILQYDIYPHFWYVFMIIGLYLFIPIIGKWVRNATEKELLYFLSIWIFTVFFNFPFFIKYNIDFNLIYFSGYIGYLVLGYFLIQNTPLIRRISSKSVSLFLIGFGIFSTVLGTYYSSLAIGKYNKFFYEYLTPNVLMTALGIFLFFKNRSLKKYILTPFFLNVSKYSYGIYFVHIFVLIFLNQFKINAEFIHPLIGVPLTSVLCLLISLLIIKLISRFTKPFNIAG